VEEFLLRLRFAADELNIVHEQNVRLAVALMKRHRGALRDRIDELVGKIVSLYIDNVHFGIVAVNLVADRVKQMGFTQSRVAVDQQGIVFAGRMVRHRLRRGVRKLVGGTDNKRFKRVFIVAAAGKDSVDDRILVGVVVRSDDAHLQRRSEYLLKGVAKAVHVKIFDRLLVKDVRYTKYRGSGLHFDRFDPRDPGFICGFCKFLPQMLTNQLPRFLKRFHPAFPLFFKV